MHNGRMHTAPGKFLPTPAVAAVLLSEATSRMGSICARDAPKTEVHFYTYGHSVLVGESSLLYRALRNAIVFLGVSMRRQCHAGVRRVPRPIEDSAKPKAKGKVKRFEGELYHYNNKGLLSILNR